MNAVVSIPGYKDISQIELAEKYLAGGPLKDAYLAALVLRYWNIIEKMCYKDYGLYDEKEAYDWFIEALMYTLTACPWRDENSSVHNDPKAIEKVLNTCVKCSRANWFQASNRQKRKINHHLASLDALSEEYKDAYMPQDLIVNDTSGKGYQYMVVEYFNKQQYLLALMIDVIVNDLDVEKCKDTKSVVSNIKKCIKSLPEDYPDTFAINYNIPKEQVEKSFSYIYNMSDGKLRQSKENYIYKLRVILKSEDN